MITKFYNFRFHLKAQDLYKFSKCFFFDNLKRRNDSWHKSQNCIHFNSVIIQRDDVDILRHFKILASWLLYFLLSIPNTHWAPIVCLVFNLALLCFSVWLQCFSCNLLLTRRVFNLSFVFWVNGKVFDVGYHARADFFIWVNFELTIFREHYFCGLVLSVFVNNCTDYHIVFKAVSWLFA